MSKTEYSVQIVWSAEDNAFVASVKELGGCMTDGETREEALENIQKEILMWLAIARDEGWPIPEPATASRLATAA